VIRIVAIIVMGSVCLVMSSVVVIMIIISIIIISESGVTGDGDGLVHGFHVIIIIISAVFRGLTS
jgi:hypothetical protein